MCRGLCVVYKITTRCSTIDVRKKSDLSRKNLTTGSPGHVRKIWDWRQPDDPFSPLDQSKSDKSSAKTYIPVDARISDMKEDVDSVAMIIALTWVSL